MLWGEHGPITFPWEPAQRPAPARGTMWLSPLGRAEGLPPHWWFQGVKVKGLILINPQNPLGDIYSPEELQEYLEFAKR